MASGRPVRVVGALLVVVLTAATATPVAGVGHPGTDATVTRIVVHEDGSADWIVEVRTRLDTNESVETFEQFAADLRANRSRYLAPYRQRMSSLVARASADTDREMQATNFRVNASVQVVPRRWGVVRYEFRWDGFAAVDGESIVVGDVLQGGLYIAQDDTLTIVAPPDHEIESVDPAPDESDGRRVTWHGERDFADGRPRVAMAPASGGLFDGALPAILGAAIGLVTLGIAAVLYRRRESGAEPASTVGTAEPMTPEDRLVDLLAERGGRCKQNELVEDVDWSKSKVSRVLGRLEEQNRVSRVRIGRENVVDLEDDEQP